MKQKWKKETTKVKEYMVYVLGVCNLLEYLEKSRYGKKFTDVDTKTETDVWKNASKK